jgi:hypothetical protein
VPARTVGTLYGTDGVRDYDALCSALGQNRNTQEAKEDTMFAPPTSWSLMTSGAGCSNIADLQREQARAVALVTPGVLTANSDGPLNGQMRFSFSSFAARRQRSALSAARRFGSNVEAMGARKLLFDRRT